MSLSRDLRVFLLYARVDQDSVQRLYKHLLKEGADAWLDEQKIRPGQDWQYEIRRAIYASDVIIVCLSRGFSKKGGYRHEELRIALERTDALPAGKTLIIPARLERCDVPESLRRWQWVDLFAAGGYRKLLDALRGCRTFRLASMHQQR